MSSLIEQAALRLAQLRQAGVDLPEVEPASGGASPATGSASGLASRQGSTAFASNPAPRAAPAPEPISISRRVELDLDALATLGIVDTHLPHIARSTGVTVRLFHADSTASFV